MFPFGPPIEKFDIKAGHYCLVVTAKHGQLPTFLQRNFKDFKDDVRNKIDGQPGRVEVEDVVGTQLREGWCSLVKEDDAKQAYGTHIEAALIRNA